MSFTRRDAGGEGKYAEAARAWAVVVYRALYILAACSLPRAAPGSGLKKGKRGPGVSTSGM